MTFVSNLRPEALWKHFDQILTIPRASKKEEGMRRYVVSVAERCGLPYRIDEAGNVVVSKPGRQEGPVTILQSHLDMVTEKNSDIEHDFSRDPIIPRQSGEYLKATGTTLGADNGIGVAAMLALMEDDEVAHGPLEFLFTIDEETGLTGASDLDGSLLSGRRLINLDSEEEGSVCVGCAGGGDSELTLAIERGPVPDGWAALDVRVSGLKGGHSGVDIHLQRANAVKVLSRCLTAAFEGSPFRIAHLRGGNLHNAIPREAGADLACEAASLESLEESLRDEFAKVREEFSAVEPNMSLALSRSEATGTAWTSERTRSVLALLDTLPHGVMSMSYDIPDLVETSTNLATVEEEDGRLRVGMSSRSSVASALSALKARIRSIAVLAGADVTEGDGYPGWKPDLDSHLLKVVKGTAKEVYGKDPVIEAIHAGLECGIIGEKCPGMDMISIGPQIEHPHSPDEQVQIESVDRFYQLLTRTLQASI